MNAVGGEGQMKSSMLAVLLVAGLTLSTPAPAQTNDNDRTPLGTRIRHDRQFPYDLPPLHVPVEKMGKVERDWSRAMLNQFGKCLYNRSKSDSLDLLDKTDFGFRDFQQIGMDTPKAAKIYGFDDCLRRVAQSNESGVLLTYSAQGLRQWLIQAAYMDQYPKGPAWLKAGNVVAARAYPLSEQYKGIKMEMEFADCVVSADPNNADYFYRTRAGSPEEQDALNTLTPSFAPCFPQGAQVQLSPAQLRTLIGEGLWQAANHSRPPSP
jgi:hypothetical protein